MAVKWFLKCLKVVPEVGKIKGKIRWEAENGPIAKLP
jgi:hypothetical protein